MSKRWTFREDVFLHAYFEAVGDFIGEHDLNRPVGSATRRVRRLKASGAWAALDRRRDAMRDYYRATIPALAKRSPETWDDVPDEEEQAA